MTLNKHLFATLITLSCIAGLIGCTPSRTLPSPQACNDFSTSIHCILNSAQQELGNIDDPFTEASAAAELAVAYDSTNDIDTARNLIIRALDVSEKIVDEKIRTKAFGEIAIAIVDMKSDADWMSVIEQLVAKRKGLEDKDSQTEIWSKSLTAEAVHGDAMVALGNIIALPQETDIQENVKAVALRKVAKILAQNGDFQSAEKAIAAITMSISYYQAIARTDVAYIAAISEQTELAKTLLLEAVPIARAQDNGYFGGGLFRDIAYGYAALGEGETAAEYYRDAIEIGVTANKQNEKARALSRIATKRSDAGDFENADMIINRAIALAEEVKSDSSRGYTYYEIVGSAALSQEFEIANTWLESVPDTPLASTASLKSAALRDIVWGLAKYGNPTQALQLADTIMTPREKIQALSRVVRVLNNPEMAALPRYP